MSKRSCIGIDSDRLFKATHFSIAQTLNLPEPTAQSALDLLKRHDVAENHNGNWRIVIALFRRWLLQENVPRG